MQGFMKNSVIFIAVIFLVVLMSGLCFAFGGKVTYPDGSPAVGAKVNLVGEKGAKETVTTDVNGQFQFAQLPQDNAEIQIKAPDGKDYLKVTLPASLFTSGNTAIVLQPK